MKRLALSNGSITLLDDADYEIVKRWTWRKDRHGYATRVRRVYISPNRYKCTTIFLHRQITDAKTGFDVDHMNRNRLDNRRSNLRQASRSQNNINSKIAHTNTSGYKGVNFHKSTGKWRAYISQSGKQIYLGLFSTIDQAASARRNKAIELYGEFINE